MFHINLLNFMKIAKNEIQKEHLVSYRVIQDEKALCTLNKLFFS